MKYTSTRDPSISVTFEEALCSGYAPGGGLFVPQSFPDRVSRETLSEEWSKLSFTQLAHTVIRKFISPDEVSDEKLEQICIRSYDVDEDENIKKSSHKNNDNILPVRRVGNAFVVELFHGPTFCFKDFGMRPVIFLLGHFASSSSFQKKKKQITLLVSTTGDTGPAAVQAVNDVNVPNLNILVHYPHGQISEFQRKQMTTIQSSKVKIASFVGGGDDMDLPIKNIQTELEGICGVNSYNIGRPLMQMVHFIWTYLRVAEQMNIEVGDPESPVDIILPTGAMGNMAAGFMAKKLLPKGVLGKLCAGVNVNDITHRVFTKGEFHKSPKLEMTLSEAINIQVPYNFERLLYYLTDESYTLVREWMTIMDKTQQLTLPSEWLVELQRHFQSARITDEDMCDMIRDIYDKHQYYIDPHSAVAFVAAQRLGYRLDATTTTTITTTTTSTNGVNNDKPAMVNQVFAILATASPCKFQEAVTVAMGEDGWKMYSESQFPSRAKEVMEKTEVNPVMYEWPEGLTLTETQMIWEQTAKKILQEDFLGETCHDK